MDQPPDKISIVTLRALLSVEEAGPTIWNTKKTVNTIHNHKAHLERHEHHTLQKTVTQNFNTRKLTVLQQDQHFHVDTSRVARLERRILELEQLVQSLL